ncbi:MAG: ADP-ribosylglycohydrolase family protein [Eubacterium sp.]|nr:ADP-ribosylglycohydrolase family protein [Eubacterium sp.]
MLGAIIGDIVGSRFEFDRSPKVKEFKIFTRTNHFTDDSVMTIAVADALMDAGVDASEENVKKKLEKSMRVWGKRIPDAGYGVMFYRWLFIPGIGPYRSYGNGSAMRVSPVGWLYDNLDKTREVARWTAEVTHNHPEGVKGAESVAAVIFLARNGYSKEYIRKYVANEFGYDLSRTCDDIRPKYRHVESCQKTVPEAMIAFLEGNDFEDVVRNAVSLGGDCDTLTDIACAMAEGMYVIPEKFKIKCREYLEPEMIEVLERFNRI